MGIVLIRLAALLVLLLSGAAAAQGMPDYCNKDLDLRADPGMVADWRMRCTIQKLVAERAEAEDKATQIEVNLAVAEAHLKSMSGRSTDATEYWKQYVAGLKFTPELEKAVDATCAWRGEVNAPTAKMCRIWREK